MDCSNAVGNLPPQLSRFVEGVRVLKPISGVPAYRVAHYPDGGITMMLRFPHGFRQLSGAGNAEICVSGPRQHALFRDFAAVGLTVLIRFRPGVAGLLLGSPAEDLRDRVVPVEEIWGQEGSRLREAVMVTQGVREMLSHVHAFLEKRERAVESRSGQIARRAVELIRHKHIAPRVKHVAGRLGVTERHLRRVFQESVGLTPKDYLRIQRLGRVLRASRGGVNWAQLAVEAGYYDQAHMIGEFREFIGLSPSAYVESQRSTPAISSLCPYM